MQKERKKIAILFGGCSTEYEVSLQSAYSVIEHLDTEKYEPVMIGLERVTGKWYLYRGGIDQIPEDKWMEQECVPVFPSADRTVHGICYLEGDAVRTISLDAALPVLHGKNGEDGTVQGVFELAGVPVIGCGVLSSALCMDKEISHRIVSDAGIKTARSVLLEENVSENEVKKAAMELGYPVFVKPDRAGSSFGITKVTDEEHLMEAVENAFLHDSIVILEETVPGFEVGCAVLGCDELTVGEIDEIELSDGFFDYTEKYTLKTSKIHVPARISREKSEELKEMAKKIYRLLQCSHFARVDMFLTPDGDIYFNEVNTIPGFTVHSRYPNMLKAAGIPFGEVISRLIEMGCGQEK